MTIDLETVLKAMASAGEMMRAIEDLVAGVIPEFGSDDQDALKASLAALRADNDAGHARLQGKLAAAGLE